VVVHFQANERPTCLSMAVDGECDAPAMNPGSMPRRPLVAVSTAARSIILLFLHARPVVRGGTGRPMAWLGARLPEAALAKGMR
jgi:hypothetical protein